MYGYLVLFCTLAALSSAQTTAKVEVGETTEQYKPDNSGQYKPDPIPTSPLGRYSDIYGPRPDLGYFQPALYPGFASQRLQGWRSPFEQSPLVPGSISPHPFPATVGPTPFPSPLPQPIGSVPFPHPLGPTPLLAALPQPLGPAPFPHPLAPAPLPAPLVPGSLIPQQLAYNPLADQLASRFGGYHERSQPLINPYNAYGRSPLTPSWSGYERSLQSPVPYPHHTSGFAPSWTGYADKLRYPGENIASSWPGFAGRSQSSIYPYNIDGRYPSEHIPRNW